MGGNHLLSRPMTCSLSKALEGRVQCPSRGTGEAQNPTPTDSQTCKLPNRVTATFDSQTACTGANLHSPAPSLEPELWPSHQLERTATAQPKADGLDKQSIKKTETGHQIPSVFPTFTSCRQIYTVQPTRTHYQSTCPRTRERFVFCSRGGFSRVPLPRPISPRT
jgi:hypothetical protein